MKYHEYADLFPLLEGDEFQKLVEDIQANGLLEPITIHEGKILDGRNRYRACMEARTKPEYVEFDIDIDPLAFVVSKNLVRRHLTVGQCAMIADSLVPMLAEHRKKSQGKRTDLDSNICKNSDISYGRATEDAGKLLGISHQSVQEAGILKREAPDLASEVQSGEKTLHRAVSEHKKREHLKQLEKTEPLPETKYRVVYADPPWKYSDSGLQEYGHAEYHYPAMTVRQLCDLPISDMLADDAVLFLWVTSPMLAECFEIIKAWGFKYKSSFIWDKVKHNYGHYNSVRHEFLLICTRGSCVPDTSKLYDSVVNIEKTRKHSEKPERFRELIGLMYPHGKRIELFSRTKAKGWDTWGAEA